MKPHRNYISEFFAVGSFAYLGVFVRIELSRSEGDYDGEVGAYSEVFISQHFLISNILGCFLIALLISHKDLLSKYSATGYVGLTSGFCGCLTTFSTWIVTNFESLFDHKNTAYFILRFVVQFSLTWSALSLGWYVGRLWSSVAKVKTNEIEMQEVARDDVEDTNVVNVDVEVCIGDGDIPPVAEEHDFRKNFIITTECCIWMVVFLSSAIALVVALSVLEAKGKGDADGVSSLTIDRLRCLVIAPPGAWLRWSLSNSRLKSKFCKLFVVSLFSTDSRMDA